MPGEAFTRELDSRRMLTLIRTNRLESGYGSLRLLVQFGSTKVSEVKAQKPTLQSDSPSKVINTKTALPINESGSL